MAMNFALKSELTLALIKPHATRHRISILRQIYSAGFHILQERLVQLTVEQAKKFLQCRREYDDYSDDKISLEIIELSSGPIIALCLSRENAIELWKNLVGRPDDNCSVTTYSMTLRALYCDDNEAKDMRNVFHGSQCENDAQRELQFFFPTMIPDPIHNNVTDIHNYLSDTISHSLTNAIHEMLKVKPSNALEWIAMHMLYHNGNQPSISPTCPETIQLIRDLKKQEKESNRKSSKCDCSLSDASSLSSCFSCSKY